MASEEVMEELLVDFIETLSTSDLEFLRTKAGEIIGDREESSKQAKPPTRPALAREDGIPDPAEIFSIPPEVRYLDSAQLDRLTESFRSWYEKGKRVDIKRARGRVWMIYLVLRYTGARLGEVLALDERTDLDLRRGFVLFRANPKRESSSDRQVHIPMEAARALADYLDSPLGYSLRGSVFKMDQGFIRRKFYDRAKDSGLPKELLNPRVLRHSRAIELLRGGVPLTIVQNVLGHATVNLTAQYLNFTEKDVRRIIKYYLQREMRKKTSARNSFTGKVVRLRTGDILTEVEVATPGGYHIVSVITNDSKTNLALEEGSIVTAAIKAPWVVVTKDETPPAMSTSNRLQAKVAKVSKGAVTTEVVADLDDGTSVVALITTYSANNLNLAPGDMVWVMFKGFAVVLNTD